MTLAEKFEDILSQLEDVREIGADKYMALCPAHDDTNPSLSITLGDDKILLHCFGAPRCTTEEICRRLGREVKDLFEKNPDNRGTRRNNKSHKAMSLFGNTNEGIKTERKLVASYPFTDESGNILYIEQKFEPKDFTFEYPNGQKTNRRVLYRLPELLAADPNEPVLLLEGCKDAETAVKMGFTATTNAFGAMSWVPDYNQYLKGRWVVIIGDNDEAGQRRVEMLKEKLDGVALRLTVIEALPDVGYKGDLSDWVKAGGSAEELRRLIAPEQKLRKSRLVSRAELKARNHQIDWLVEDLIPKRSLVLLTADPKVGKTVMSFNLANALIRSEQFLGFNTRRARIGILQLEDDAALINARFDEIGLPMNDVFYWEGKPDVEEMVDIIKEGRLDLVIIDPLSDYAEGLGLDENSALDMTNLFKDLKEVVKQTGATILVIHHHNKSEYPGHNNIRGSTAIQAKVDVMMRIHQVNKLYKMNVRSRYKTVNDILLRQNPEKKLWVRADSNKEDKLDETEQPVKEENDASVDSRIMEALKRHPDSSVKQVTDYVNEDGGKPTTENYIDKRLRELFNEGKVKRIKYGRSYVYMLA